ncbi:MAG: pantetheine-phosphate adenylyltransferase [Aquiluna sp.]|nr:pantetheine-phosphate adenylyltransferase [Aquiluna sp.]MCF8545299.1 pantetheine-phosphate adenylyltransferase [Aquiluna sp.]
MKTVAIYPGSFDPITLGHLSVLKRAVGIFGEIAVVVVHNPNKSPLFSSKERVEMISQTLVEAKIDGVRVLELESGLLVDFARDLNAKVILKGFRSESDIEYELPMAQVNRDLTSIETVFLPSEPEYGYVSSSLVKEVAKLGGDVSQYLTKSIEKALVERLQK